MPKLITLSVRDFALPSPRTGSIEAHSGYGRAQQQGLEIHQLVQQRRASEDPTYEAEVTVQRELERGDYLFRVTGRMDGIFRPDPSNAAPRAPKIEEIKTSFNIWELAR